MIANVSNLGGLRQASVRHMTTRAQLSRANCFHEPEAAQSTGPVEQIKEPPILLIDVHAVISQKARIRRHGAAVVKTVASIY